MFGVNKSRVFFWSNNFEVSNLCSFWLKFYIIYGLLFIFFEINFLSGIIIYDLKICFEIGSVNLMYMFFIYM